MEKFKIFLIASLISAPTWAQLKTEDHGGQVVDPSQLSAPQMQDMLKQMGSQMDEKQLKELMENLKSVQKQMQDRNKVMDMYFKQDDELFKNKKKKAY